MCENCNDPNCKREVKATKQGKLYIVNFFTCGKVKDQIERLLKFKI